MRWPFLTYFRAGYRGTMPIKIRSESDMPPKDFKCKQCGHCCINLNGAFTTTAYEKDIQLWREQGRQDILDWARAIHPGGDNYVYDLWIDPSTGDDAQECPWLKKLPDQDKYVCLIHEVKPTHDREFPKTRQHAEEEGCKGFEP